MKTNALRSPLHRLLAGLSVSIALAACGDEETITPLPDLVITTTSLPSGVVDVDYQVELAAEGGSAADYRWSVQQGRLPSGVFLRSEGTPSTVLAGRPRSTGTTRFTLRVRDSEGNEGTVELSIEVAAAPPAVEITTESLPEALVGTPYEATVEAANGSDLAWRIVAGELPPGLSLDASGTPATRIGGTPVLDGRYSFTVRAVSADGQRATRQLSLVVAEVEAELRLVRAELPSGQATAPYVAELEATGLPVGEVRWTVFAGELPPGLTLEPVGFPNARLSGVPTRPGAYAFRIQIEDEDRNLARESFFIEVGEAPLPLRVATFELPPGEVGRPYEETIRSTGGLAEQVSWSVSRGALPPGLRLVEGSPDATLSGTPTADGRYAFTLDVSDPAGQRSDQSFVVDVRPELIPVSITATSAVGGVIVLPDAEGGQPYRATLEAVDGAPLPIGSSSSERRYNWIVSEGALPPGLALAVAGDADTGRGVISGVAAALGTYTATVTVYDPANGTDSQAVRVTVAPPSIPLEITTTTAPNLAGTGCDSVEISAAGGGNSNFSWRVIGGTLPPGFELDPTGTPTTRIRGATRVTSGSYPVTLEVTDGFGLTATRALTFTVDPAKVGSPRWGVLVGDIETSGRNEVFVQDLCTDAAPSPVRVSQSAHAGGNVLFSTRDIGLSPRGDALAFLADLDVDGRDDVYLVDLRTEPTLASARRIFTSVDTNLEASELKWSPDGRKLAVFADMTLSLADELWVVDLTDLANPGAPVRVSQPGTSSSLDVYANDYEFSPDGRKIAWVGDNASSSVDELWVVDLSGAVPTAPARAHVTMPSTSDINGSFLWTPDSRGLVFNADLDATSRDEIFFTDVSGAPPYTQVRVSGALQVSGDFFANFTQGVHEHMAFSEDGTTLFFIGDAVNEGREDLFIATYGNGTFSARTAVTAHTISFATCDSAKWSPDGSRILVRGDLRGSSQDELFVFDVLGTLPITNPTPLRGGDTSREMGFSFLEDYRWSPTGDAVAFIGDFDLVNAEELYYADVSGPTPMVTKLNEPFSSSAQQVGEFRFSPSGGRLVYLSDQRSSFDELRVVDLGPTGPGPAQLLHPTLTVSGLGVFQNTDGFDNAWFWIDEQALILRGDLETSGCDRAYRVDLAGGPPFTPISLTTSSQAPTCNEDVFFLVR